MSPPALAERSRKTSLFARSLRALAPLPSLLPLFSQCDPADRRSAKIQFRKIRSSVKTRRAAARSRPMRRAAPRLYGSESILRRPRTDKGKSYFDCAVDTPPRQNPNKFGSARSLRTSRRTNLRSDKLRLGKTANSVCFCPQLAHFTEDKPPLR